MWTKLQCATLKASTRSSTLQSSKSQEERNKSDIFKTPKIKQTAIFPAHPALNFELQNSKIIMSTTITPLVVKDPKPNFPMENRNVRVIAKIRAFTEAEKELVPWISVQKPNDELAAEKALISFRDQPSSRKEVFEVDCCYEQHKDNCLIFEREVKPLIAKLFDGVNSSIIAYGARGSGKTYTIQGSDEELGLAGLAIAELLLRADETGKIVKISYFEICNDHAFDLLDPKVQEVQALKDAQGKIQLRGLSQVQVKSLPEFKKMYFKDSDLHKSSQNAHECTQRSHKGLILYLSSLDKHTKHNIVGKMNFVDLAGYEDTRRKTIGGSEIVDNARMNKTLYALHNVVHALNAKEIHVPYRESKLTRMLQDSLGGPNFIVMLACLKPSFCQDTIYMASLAFRCYQGINRVSMDSTKKVKSVASINRVSMDSTKKVKSVARSVILSSTKKILKSGTASASVNKQTSSRVPLSEKKSNIARSELRGRRLFLDANQRNNIKQEKSLSNSVVKVSKPKPQEEKIISDLSKPITCREEEIPQSLDTEPSDIMEKEIPRSHTELSDIMEKEESVSDLSKANICTEEDNLQPFEIKDTDCSDITKKVVSPYMEKDDLQTTGSKTLSEVTNLFEEGLNQNNSSLSEYVSPPISARLEELSSSFKSVFSSTPLCMTTPQFSSEMVEPRTPVPEQNLRNIASPRSLFNVNSTGIKDSLVREHLKFLNSANKDELKRLKGVGEKRAAYILQLREKSPDHFKDLDDLKDIGLSEKQIKGMMKNVAGDIFA